MAADDRTLQALIRTDFRAFIHKVFATLTPGQDYVRTWHVEAIAYQLERVRPDHGFPWASWVVPDGRILIAIANRAESLCDATGSRLPA